jgi:APA family basic amino acid/polyamine antiporter
MVGSGIFIVSADIAQQVKTSGLLIAIWVFTGIVTLLGATSYGKLAAHMPRAGGQYVFLKEAWGEIPAFLYGWILLTVIQTGFLAAVAVAFTKYLGVIFPVVSSQPLFQLTPNFGISAQQLLAVALLIGLTAFNATGVKNGALLQNIFTTLKVLALLLLIILGFAFGHNLLGGPHAAPIDWSFSIPGESIFSQAFIATFATATVGALFSADAWNYVTFIGGEVKDASRILPKALTLGTTVVVMLYLLVNFAYLNVLPLDVIQHAPESRVATAAIQPIFGSAGALVMALIILISTFGCLNGMVLAGARVFYAMAKDGLLFPQFGQVDPKTHSPNFSLWMQCIWGSLLALSGTYSQLLDYIVFSALVFYIVTLAGLIKMGKENPNEMRMKTWWDFAMPSLYIGCASYIGFFLLFSPQKWFTSVAGLGLTLLGLPIYFVWKKWGISPAAASID